MNRRRDAFTLVEVTLAIGVAAFSFIAIFGLLPVGLATNQAALEQTAAASLLSAVVSDLRATPPKTTTTAQFNINLAAAGPALYFTNDGRLVGSTDAAAHFLLSVAYASNANYVGNLPAGGVSRAPTLAQVKISWPASAGAVHPIGSVESLVVLDRN